MIYRILFYESRILTLIICEITFPIYGVEVSSLLKLSEIDTKKLLSVVLNILDITSIFVELS